MNGITYNGDILLLHIATAYINANTNYSVRYMATDIRVQVKLYLNVELFFFSVCYFI